MIRKTKNGKFIVKSKDGKKNLSKPETKEEAEARLRAIEYFKNKGGK